MATCLVLAVLADVGVAERREVKVVLFPGLEDDGAAVSGVREEVEGLVVPEGDGLAAVR